VNFFSFLLFGSIFVFRVIMTVCTQMQISLWEFPHWQSQYVGNLWAMRFRTRTLDSSHSSYRSATKTSMAARILWFLLIMALGNMAMSAYLLLQLFRLSSDEAVANVITRRA